VPEAEAQQSVVEAEAQHVAMEAEHNRLWCRLRHIKPRCRLRCSMLWCSSFVALSGEILDPGAQAEVQQAVVLAEVQLVEV
jgi:hypothetical protein